MTEMTSVETAEAEAGSLACGAMTMIWRRRTVAVSASARTDATAVIRTEIAVMAGVVENVETTMRTTKKMRSIMLRDTAQAISSMTSLELTLSVLSRATLRTMSVAMPESAAVKLGENYTTSQDDASSEISSRIREMNGVIALLRPRVPISLIVTTVSSARLMTL